MVGEGGRGREEEDMHSSHNSHSQQARPPSHTDLVVLVAEAVRLAVGHSWVCGSVGRRLLIRPENSKTLNCSYAGNF